MESENKRRPRATVQDWAAAAGFLLILSVLGGGFGEAYVPSQIIVPGDAAATAEKIRASESLFRLGFAGYLLETVCDVALALVFYVLLRPASRNLSLLAAFFGLLATATFAFAELFYFSTLAIVGDRGALNAFSPGQLDALALLHLRIYGYGATLFTVFYGLAWIVRGYLMIRSGYFPKLLGVLLALGGLGFVMRNVLFILAPAYASPYFLLAIFPGALLFALWLLIRGVNVRKWEQAVAAAALSEATGE